MLSFDEALNELKKASFGVVGVEFVGLKEAVGRVLACDVRAGFDYPAFATLSLDGVACASCELKEGAKLEIIASLKAGDEPRQSPQKAQCIKSFTGALLSANCDTLLPLENYEIITENGKEYALVKEVVEAGFGVRQVGESYKKGQIILKSGTKVEFSEIAVLCELGLDKVCVIKKPKVAVLATGSELIEPGKKLQNPAQIYNSNAYALFALLGSWGCECEILPSVKDEPKELENTLKRALESYDIIVSTGGVSVGEYDFMRDFVRAWGEVIIDKCAIKPGRHIKIAKIKGKMLFALPGFTYSALVTAVLFIKAYLGWLFGSAQNEEKTAILAHDISIKPGLTNFIAADIYSAGGTNFVSTESKKSGSSAISTNLLNAPVLLKLETNAKKGDIVSYLEI